MVNNGVLIIEDDKNIAEYFKAVLTMAGMQVEVVLSAREGLVRLAGNVPGLILLDMNLGKEIGGEDILYQIRSNPRLDGTRVIVITGYPNTVQLVADLADLILIKPVGIDQLTVLAQRMIAYKAEARIHAFRDPVTSLFNMEFFHTRLDLAFERAKRRGDFLYGVIEFQVEVDGPLAEAVQHNVDLSTAILMEISKRMKQNIRPTDTIARVTEWRFITLHEDLRRFEDIAIVIDRLQNILAAPFEYDSNPYHLNMYYGHVVSDSKYRKPTDIITEVDRLLEQALQKKYA